MSKSKFVKKPRIVRRNPDRVTARHIDPVAYHATDAYASLDDEIDNWERDSGTQPFNNPAYYASIYD